MFEQALLRQTLCAFGEDGFGKYGKHDIAQYFLVSDISVDIMADDDNMPTVITGKLSICLRDYDADVVGHIVTDQNFEISLGQKLKAAGISPKALTWASINEQVPGCVTFNINLDQMP